MEPSSLGVFAWLEPDMMSGRVSDVCDKFRAFWAAPRMPSLLKLAARCLIVAGDFIVFTEPLLAEESGAPCRSMLKLPWVGRENLPTVAAVVADRGESPVDDGDMVEVWRWSCVDDVVGNRVVAAALRAPEHHERELQWLSDRGC